MSINWRASLVPAVAVIPAPIAVAALCVLSGYPARHYPKMSDPAHLRHPFHRLLGGRWNLARLVRLR